jgi:hypothetical protein
MEPLEVYNTALKSIGKKAWYSDSGRIIIVEIIGARITRWPNNPIERDFSSFENVEQPISGVETVSVYVKQSGISYGTHWVPWDKIRFGSINPLKN